MILQDKHFLQDSYKTLQDRRVSSTRATLDVQKPLHQEVTIPNCFSQDTSTCCIFDHNLFQIKFDFLHPKPKDVYKNIFLSAQDESATQTHILNIFQRPSKL